MTPADGEKVLEAQAMTVAWMNGDGGDQLLEMELTNADGHHATGGVVGPQRKGGLVMRSKAPLALMEQLVMVLVFALAAALCVQVFVLSGQTSRWNESRIGRLSRHRMQRRSSKV